MSQPILLSAHDAIIKMLGERSKYLNKWLDHVHFDDSKHVLLQFPVAGQPLHFQSHFFLVQREKLQMVKDAFGNGDIEAANYLANCPQILIQQSVATADPMQHYRQIRSMNRN